MNRSARGFTLLELMITVALAGIVLSLGVPAIRDFARNGRLTGASNEMLVTVVAARNAAMRENFTVSVCPSANPDADTAACSASATEGYIAFVDSTPNCERDAGEELVANFSIHSDVRVARNSTCISFDPTGFRRVVPAQPAVARTMFCDDRQNTLSHADVSNARGLEVLPTGRAYVSRVHSELTSWASGANTVACP